MQITEKICTPMLGKGYSPYLFYFLFNCKDHLRKNMAICDVGCGRKRNLKLLSTLGFKNLSGCDLFNYSNTEEDINVDFQRVDLNNTIPFPGITFDMVICNHVFMFIEPNSREFFMKNLIRLVAPGGLLCFEFYNPKEKNVNGRKREMLYAYVTKIEEALQHIDVNEFEILNSRKYGFFARRIKYGREKINHN